MYSLEGAFGAILIPRCLIYGQDLYSSLPNLFLVSGCFRLLGHVTDNMDRSSLCSTLFLIKTTRGLLEYILLHSVVETDYQLAPLEDSGSLELF